MTGLKEAVQYMADVLNRVDTGNVWEHFTCTEIESIADVLRAVGRSDVAEFILAEHGEHDEPGDEHYTEVPEWEIVCSLGTGEPRRCGGLTFPSEKLANDKLGAWRRLHPHLSKAWSIRQVESKGAFL